MLNQLTKTLKRFQMLEIGEGVVVGVSGGPDSLALLHALLTLRDAWSLRLVAVHVHHGLRGAAADADAVFVRKFCLENEIPFYVFEVDVQKLAIDSGHSFEMEGRRVRYEAFERVAAEEGCTKIAIAQNMNDQCETLLMRLFRGAGLKGLGATQPVREGKFIRPLIETTREEIERYCQEQQLIPRKDHTNFEVDYDRNRIRLEVIPYLKAHFNPKLIETISRTTTLLREDEALLERVTTEALALRKINMQTCSAFFNQMLEDFENSLKMQPDSIIGIDLSGFNLLEVALQRRLIRKMAETALGGVLTDFSQLHVDAIIALTVSSEGTKRFNASGVMALRIYESLWIGRINSRETITKPANGVSEAEPHVLSDLNEWKVELVEMDREDWLCRLKNPEILDANSVMVDLDKISGALSVRFRKEGDRFIPFGMTEAKRLKRFMVDEKIPQNLRNKIPLVCDEKQIIWVYGYRMSENVRVRDDTLHVGRLTLTGIGCSHQ